MGLTIHYDLKTDLTKPQDVRQLVETIRQHALDMPFKELCEINEFTEPETRWDNKDDPDRWLKIQSAGHVSAGHTHYTIPALNIIAFSTLPGDGCEPANFGLCRYPAYFKTEKGRKATRLNGWRWHSFCKTQYASDPTCGGVENFLRCHLLVIKMLDFIKQTGLIEVEVSDESDYWQNRDVKKLVEEVGEWNEFVAGLASELRSTAEGKSIVAPITGFPNFEHLEAKGLERIAELRRKLGDNPCQTN
jgi:hypothetical protein